MDLVSFVKSKFGASIGVQLGRMLTPHQAYGLGDWIVQRIASKHDLEIVQGIRSNQAVIRGIPFEDKRLDAAIVEVLQNAAHGYADWFRLMAAGPEALLDSIEVDDGIYKSLEIASADDRGLVMVGPHMSSFNVLLLALGVSGFEIQALSHPVEQGGFIVDNEIRRKFGLIVTPISPNSLRDAIRRLKNGGVVLTGVDRPDVGGDELTFFNRKTTLPIGHARLAVRTNSRLLIGVVQSLGLQRYRAVCSPLIEPVYTGDQQRDVIVLAQKVINELEKFVRDRPGEWLMFLPVWPETLKGFQAG